MSSRSACPAATKPRSMWLYVLRDCWVCRAVSRQAITAIWKLRVTAVAAVTGEVAEVRRDFQPAEEQFDLPAIPVQGRDQMGRQVPQIGQQPQGRSFPWRSVYWTLTSRSRAPGGTYLFEPPKCPSVSERTPAS